MSGRVCVLGSFMMDLVAYAPRRPEPGETIKGSSFVIAVGGKGFNQAVAASRAGAQSFMLGRLGSDSFGNSFIETLASEGIDASGVERDAEMGTGVGLPVVSADGDNSIIIIPRSNDLADESFVQRHADVIRSSDVLLLQLELPKSGAVAAARIAQKAGVRVVLTPAPVASLDDYVGLIDVLVPNEIEAAALTDESESIQDQAKSLMKKLGCTEVVITLGSKGAYVTNGTLSEMVVAPPVDTVDTIGAGDTLCGYLSARLAAGDDLFEAARHVVYAASLSVTRRGAALAAPHADEVEAFLRGLSLETVTE
ncbi:MAG TPA: ribokinase [Candidatus Nanopelagicaceae bacterium]